MTIMLNVKTSFVKIYCAKTANQIMDVLIGKIIIKERKQRYIKEHNKN